MSNLMDVREVAEWLGYHPETVREMARRKQIPAIKLGGRTSPYRFRRSSIEAWLTTRETKAEHRGRW